MSAIAAVPADTHALANLPAGETSRDRLDSSGHLVTGNTRVLNAREQSLFGDRIAMTDAARQHLDPHRSSLRFRYRPFDDFKRTLGTRDLCNTHGRHGFLLL